jgi:predicted transcriptional regulator
MQNEQITGLVELANEMEGSCHSCRYSLRIAVQFTRLLKSLQLGVFGDAGSAVAEAARKIEQVDSLLGEVLSMKVPLAVTEALRPATTPPLQAEAPSPHPQESVEPSTPSLPLI